VDLSGVAASEADLGAAWSQVEVLDAWPEDLAGACGTPAKPGSCHRRSGPEVRALAVTGEAGYMLSDTGKLVWAGVRGLLPYPDLPRRFRMRRAAFKLITCKRWPGEDATGDDAAQLAVLRLLWLQRRIRRAVRSRRGEEAALLARSAVDACIIGLYCLHSGTAVADLSAANNSAAGRVMGYLTGDGLS
jgi:hypothetical protein